MPLNLSKSRVKTLNIIIFQINQYKEIETIELCDSEL